MTRILKLSNRQLRRMLVSAANENLLLKQANHRLKQRLEKYEGPEMEPGQLIMPATVQDLAKVQGGA